MKKTVIPLDGPESTRETYRKNYEKMTHGVGRLMLMASDKKDGAPQRRLFCPGIAAQEADPEHPLRIASQTHIGIFATQTRLAVRYDTDNLDVPYLVKMNTQTRLIKTAQRDPLRYQLQTLEQLIRFRASSSMQILGVGYTIYPGSEVEVVMLAEAAWLIFKAHQHFLLTVMWTYPRGQTVSDEKGWSPGSGRGWRRRLPGCRLCQGRLASWRRRRINGSAERSRAGRLAHRPHLCRRSGNDARGIFRTLAHAGSGRLDGGQHHWTQYPPALLGSADDLS
jgi:hypothetical protein